MSTATVTTDISIGPYKIPSNGQNMIMNNYAFRKKINIEFVIPEPIISNQLATTQWCHKDYNFTKVILCSIHQLPKEKKYLDKLVKSMNSVEFHFALEGIYGKGKKFILECSNEAKIFDRALKIKKENINWLELLDNYKKDT